MAGSLSSQLRYTPVSFFIKIAFPGNRSENKARQFLPIAEGATGLFTVITEISCIKCCHEYNSFLKNYIFITSSSEKVGLPCKVSHAKDDKHS